MTRLKKKFTTRGAPSELREIAIGMILSDACMYKKSKHAIIKFEQGYQQEEFLSHLFLKFKLYCFMVQPGKRLDLHGNRKGLIKSLWFKTFSHESFTQIWNLFYLKNSKQITEGLIKNHLSNIGLAYWIMGDGSLQKDKKRRAAPSYSKLYLYRKQNSKYGTKWKIWF